MLFSRAIRQEPLWGSFILRVMKAEAAGGQPEEVDMVLVVVGCKSLLIRDGVRQGCESGSRFGANNPPFAI